MRSTLPPEFRVVFGACYAYSPQGSTEVCGRSRLLCSRVKAGRAKWLRCYAARVHEQVVDQRLFRGYFSRSSLLIPIPQSDPAASSAALRLALAVKATGLAGTVWKGLSRVCPVQKSSAAFYWERPAVADHYASFVVEQAPIQPTQILLIDDVITKGRTLMAAAMRLREVFPSTPIRAFALLRTMGLVPDIERLIDPCEGEIAWDGKDTHREP